MNASPGTTSVLPSLWRRVPFPEITKYNSHWAECAWQGKLLLPRGTRFNSRSNGCRFDKSSEAGSRPSASEIPLKETAYFPPGDCHGSCLISFRLTFFTAVNHRRGRGVRREGIQNFSASSAVKASFFAIEVISLRSFHDHFFPRIFCHRPFSAVGIITGITRRAAATGIIGDHIINKVLIIRIPKLMRFPWLKEECVTRFHFAYAMLVAHAAAARKHQVKLRFSRVRVIGTKEFAFGNSD